MSSFLYPFLDAEPAPNATPGGSVTELDELAEAAIATWATSSALHDATIEANAAGIERVARLLADTMRTGGCIFPCGNGGSATDAARMLRLLPTSMRARTLMDAAVVTAIANDLGAVNVFARQIAAAVRAGDVVVLFTTSGTSANIVEAARQAHASGARTVALAGYGGGTLLGLPEVDVCLVVDSESTHRIQEAQGGLVDAVIFRVGAIAGSELS